MAIRRFWSVRDELTTDGRLVVKGKRIAVPINISSRHAVLAALHAAHQGVERTKRRARQTVSYVA